MTSKDELRRYANRIRDAYTLNEAESILVNLLEGEKQKARQELTKRHKKVTEKWFELLVKELGYEHARAYKDIIETYARQLATLNKEPNKGEDVDE